MLNKFLKKQELALVAFFIVLLFFSLAYLSAKGKFETEKALDSFQWSAYFSDPVAKNIDFGIRNNSLEKEFHWEIYLGEAKITEGDTNVKRREQKNIDISGFEDSIDKKTNENFKVMVRISADGEKKEIYKYL